MFWKTPRQATCAMRSSSASLTSSQTTNGSFPPSSSTTYDHPPRPSRVSSRTLAHAAGRPSRRGEARGGGAHHVPSHRRRPDEDQLVDA